MIKKTRDLIQAKELILNETKIQKKRISHFNSLMNANVERIIPIEKKLIVLVDIVGFSKKNTYDQWRGLMIFQQYLRSTVLKSNLLRHVNVTHFVPTGDGCYMLANECEPELALEFVCSIVRGFQKVQPEDEFPLSLRASALIGQVMPIMDLAMHKNYIGEGMNEGSRVLSGGQKSLEEFYIQNYRKEHNKEPVNEDVKMFSRNSVFVDDSLSGYVQKFAEFGKLYEFKNVADKHGKMRNITVLQGIK